MAFDPTTKTRKCFAKIIAIGVVVVVCILVGWIYAVAIGATSLIVCYGENQR